MRSALLLALTLLFVVTGCGASGGSGDAARTPSSAPAGASSTSSSVAKSAPYGALSIVRTGNGFTLTGEVPDESLKTGLPATLRQALPGAKIVDELTVKPGVTGPEFSGLGALFGAAMDVRGFEVKLAGNTATLTGTADTDAARSAAETAAMQTWPDVLVANDIRVGGCGASQADLAAAVKTPITFPVNGFGLTPDARRLVATVADAGRACQGTTLTVVGYTDDTGGDAVNVPLSVSRAKAVADALIADGVPAAEVTSRGAGAANPVAANDTAAGRAQNRRVEIALG